MIKILKKILKFFIPRKLRILGRYYYYSKIKAFYLRGDTVECPCCGSKFKRFLPFGVQKRENVWCPKCGSLERHRLLRLYLAERTNLFTDNLKVLHFAPERALYRTLKQLRNLEYRTADLMVSYMPFTGVKPNYNMDVTDIKFSDNSFDVIICNHVLEHVPDDGKAMSELYRVLKHGGWAILQVPIDTKREKTLENPKITSKEDRRKYYGSPYHVRLYGRDYKNKLEEVGFGVKVDSFVTELRDEKINRYRLQKGEDIYFCFK